MEAIEDISSVRWMVASTRFVAAGRKQPPVAKQNLTPYLVFCIISITLGSSLTCGMNRILPIAANDDLLNPLFARGETASSELRLCFRLGNFIYCASALIGCIWFAGALAAFLGKRNALLATSAIGVIGAIVLSATPWMESVIPFLVGRAIVGIQGGLSMVIAPDLIAQYAPARLRGACCSLFTLGIPIGLELTSLVRNIILTETNTWHYIFLILLAIYTIHAVCLVFVPESPVYLLRKKKDERSAVKVYRKLRSATEREVRSEIDGTLQLIDSEQPIAAIPFCHFYKYCQLWWPMIIITHMAIVFIGFETATAVCADLLPTVSSQHISITGDGSKFLPVPAIIDYCLRALPILGVALCAALADRFGRRYLMIIPLYVMAAAISIMLLIAITSEIWQIGIAAYAFFRICQGIGPGYLPFYLAGEMYPQAVRPTGYAMASFAIWCASILDLFYFDTIGTLFGPYSLAPLILMWFYVATFYVFFLPETSSRLAGYDADRFAPTRSLFQVNCLSDNKETTV